MNSAIERPWKVLSWNVRGINAERKWDTVKDKILNSACDIVCLQETKKENFDSQFLKRVCPRDFDAFEFLPSNGATGGMLVAWKSKFFSGTLVFSNAFAMSVEFVSKHNDDNWLLSNVYGPCTVDGKREFTTWLKNIDMPDHVSWLLLGDFNLIRSQENRNRPGGNIEEMLIFNEAISTLGLTEIPLQGKKYTWSNMQSPPLLEKLDWVFTSNAWTLCYPETSVLGLTREPSDHCPCLVSISASIPRGKVFRFENFWLDCEGFQNILQENWLNHPSQQDIAKHITAKFKVLRSKLKSWQSSLSNLKSNISKK